MFARFIDGGVVSTDFAIVLIIGIAFFCIQISLCFTVCNRARRHERRLARLRHEFEEGGVRPVSSGNQPTSAWTDWVFAHYPADKVQVSGNFTRDDALQELDTRLANDGSYLLLQRMGVMAPLLGVVLTVAGFYWLEVDADDQSLQNILSAVTPLISGVGTGAILAMINQALLHIAGRRLESLRMTARTWFDCVVWNRIGSNSLSGSTTAVQLTDILVQGALDDIDQLSDKLGRLAEISAAISTLPDQIRDVLDQKLPFEHKVDSAKVKEPFAGRLPRAVK